MDSVEKNDSENITIGAVKNLLEEVEAEIKNMFREIMALYKTRFGADLFGAGSDIEDLDWLKRIGCQRHLIRNLMTGASSCLFAIEKYLDRNDLVRYFELLMSMASICAMLEMEQAATYTAVRDTPEYLRPTNLHNAIYEKMMRIKEMLNSLGLKTTCDD